MSIKDLVVSKTDIGEELVESLLIGRVRLIEESSEVQLSPGTRGLPSATRILLYLCGKKAWSLLRNKELTTPIVELSNNLGIKGNTLRPTLKRLRDSRLIESKSGQYCILPMGVLHLQQYFEEEDVKAAAEGGEKENVRDKSKSKGKKERRGTERKPRRAPTAGIGEQLRIMVEEGFFGEPKGLSEIQTELEKRAFIIPLTSLPLYVIDLVRGKALNREKEKRGRRKVWVYKSPPRKQNHYD